MKILITNDDGYKAGGMMALVRAMRPLGDLTIVAPKSSQSGTSLSITMGGKAIAVKKLSEDAHERWYYLDGTPASCVKYGLDNVFIDEKPDFVISGINYGANYATAALYSGTVGAAMEAAVNHCIGISVSLDNFSLDADFSAAEELIPEIVKTIITNHNPKYGTFYNINIPAIPKGKIKGVRISHMGHAHWEKEYQPYTKAPLPPTEEGEELYVMAGDFTDEANTPGADHHFVNDGYISITIHNIDNTDYDELKRLEQIFSI